MSKFGHWFAGAGFMNNSRNKIRLLTVPPKSGHTDWESISGLKKTKYTCQIKLSVLSYLQTTEWDSWLHRLWIPGTTWVVTTCRSSINSSCASSIRLLDLQFRTTNEYRGQSAALSRAVTKALARKAQFELPPTVKLMRFPDGPPMSWGIVALDTCAIA